MGFLVEQKAKIEYGHHDADEHVERDDVFDAHGSGTS